MKAYRMMGLYVENTANAKNITIEEMSSATNCSRDYFKSFLSGRAVLSFNQLKVLSQLLEVSVGQILAGNQKDYDDSIVHCFNDFDDTDNREMILDIIDDYFDLKESLYNGSSIQ